MGILYLNILTCLNVFKETHCIKLSPVLDTYSLNDLKISIIAVLLVINNKNITII